MVKTPHIQPTCPLVEDPRYFRHNPFVRSFDHGSYTGYGAPHFKPHLNKEEGGQSSRSGPPALDQRCRLGPVCFGSLGLAACIYYRLMDGNENIFAEIRLGAVFACRADSTSRLAMRALLGSIEVLRLPRRIYSANLLSWCVEFRDAGLRPFGGSCRFICHL